MARFLFGLLATGSWPTSFSAAGPSLGLVHAATVSLVSTSTISSRQPRACHEASETVTSPVQAAIVETDSEEHHLRAIYSSFKLRVMWLEIKVRVTFRLLNVSRPFEGTKR